MKINRSCLLLALALALPALAPGGDIMANSVHAFTMQNIEGVDVPLAKFKGKVLLIVNVASRCGLTKQYAELQKLYEKYNAQGLEILGFPANNFARQEPGSDADIKQFCTLNYGVTFPMFAKVSVKGDDQCPLYAFLTDKKIHPEFGGGIGWNFAKFLTDREGRVIGRFGSRTTPMDEEIIKAIEKALAAPAPAP
jgi:glutathione peroxidase